MTTYFEHIHEMPEEDRARRGVVEVDAEAVKETRTLLNDLNDWCMWNFTRNQDARIGTELHQRIRALRDRLGRGDK